MNNFEPSLKAEKPPVAYSEIKIKTLILDIELKKDKNQSDYWVIRTKLATTRSDYLAFSGDYSLSPKTLQLLTNYPHQLVNNWAVLTTRKREQDNWAKVIAIDLEKD